MIKVGFIGSVSKEWMGGLNYFKNLLLAINSIEKKELEVFVFVGKKIDIETKRMFQEYATVIEDSVFDRKSIKWFLSKIEQKIFKTNKKNKILVYLRNSEDIMDILVLMDALQHFFEYEETTIIKNLKNKTIREMNWEVANETKTLNTGNYQIKMIKYIGEKIGLNSLSPVLEEAAFLRLNNPEDSLQSLADMINISKSGIRNRFRRIEEIYNSLLEEEKNS